MKRWAGVVALGGLLAVITIVVVQPRPIPTLAERADAVSRGLRCPDCQGLSVADSPTGSAQEIRRQIDQLIADGETDDEVREHFVARYGEWILLAPASPLVWIVPFAVVLAGAAALVGWLVARRQAPRPTPNLALTPDERQRLHEEAEALDA